MKPEQQEIARLRREVNKLRAERDILNSIATATAPESPPQILPPGMR
jgi:transposase